MISIPCMCQAWVMTLESTAESGMKLYCDAVKWKFKQNFKPGLVWVLKYVRFCSSFPLLMPLISSFFLIFPFYRFIKTCWTVTCMSVKWRACRIHLVSTRGSIVMFSKLKVPLVSPSWLKVKGEHNKRPALTPEQQRPCCVSISVFTLCLFGSSWRSTNTVRRPCSEHQPWNNEWAQADGSDTAENGVKYDRLSLRCQVWWYSIFFLLSTNSKQKPTKLTIHWAANKSCVCVTVWCIFFLFDIELHCCPESIKTHQWAALFSSSGTGAKLLYWKSRLLLTSSNLSSFHHHEVDECGFWVKMFRIRYFKFMAKFLQNWPVGLSTQTH